MTVSKRKHVSMSTGSLLNENSAADYLGLSPRTLQGKRVSGDGPDFVRLGRTIRYRPGDLDDFIKDRVHSQTSQYQGYVEDDEFDDEDEDEYDDD